MILQHNKKCLRQGYTPVTACIYSLTRPPSTLTLTSGFRPTPLPSRTNGGWFLSDAEFAMCFCLPPQMGPMTPDAGLQESCFQTTSEYDHS